MSALLEIIAFFVDHGVWVAAGSALAVGVAMLASMPLSRQTLRRFTQHTASTTPPSRLSASTVPTPTSDPMELLRSLARARKASILTFGEPDNVDGWEEKKGRSKARSRLRLHSFKQQYRKLPPKTPIIVLLSEECDLDASTARVIAKILLAHDSETSALIPFRVFGPACLIALAAHEIIMSTDAIMVVDADNLSYALEAAKLKKPRRMTDEALLDLHDARQVLRETGWLAELLLQARKVRGWRRFTRAIKTGQFNMNSPIRVEDLRRWGLRTTTISLGHPTSAKSKEKTTKALLASSSDPILVGTGVPPVCAQSCPIGEARNAMLALEQRRGTKVISIIHSRGMSEEDLDDQTTAEAVSAIRATPSGIDLDIILHTPGGQSLGASQIVHALKSHKGRKTVFVPYRAMSAGTIISLTADEIFLSALASLGPIDAQMPVSKDIYLPAAALASLLKHKSPKDIDDHLLRQAVEASDCIRSDHKQALAAMKGNYPRLRAERIARTLNDGYLSHGFPLMYKEARMIGLHVRLGVPNEVFTIVDSFLSSGNGFCSVIHCPD